MTLALLDKAIKDLYAGAVQEHLKVHAQYLWNNYTGKESPMPSTSTTSKLQTWGCPACGGFGHFYDVPDMDQIGCKKCDTVFSGIFLAKWDGKPYPQLVGTKHSGWTQVSVPDEDDYDPIMDSSLGAKLLDLKEKVILFREAVVNPDRVTTDEEVERLLKELFEVSYTLPVSADVEKELTEDKYKGDPPDIAPDTYESEQQYKAALIESFKDGYITEQQAIDLLKAFGGDDPFESLEDKGITLDFQEVEDPDAYIDPYGDT